MSVLCHLSVSVCVYVCVCDCVCDACICICTGDSVADCGYDRDLYCSTVSRTQTNGSAVLKTVGKLSL